MQWQEYSSGRKPDSKAVDLDEVFERPGKQWSQEDVEACLSWLYRTRYEAIVKVGRRQLGARSVREDAEEAWQDFASNSLAATLWTYDPRKGRKLLSWVLYCFRLHCTKIKLGPPAPQIPGAARRPLPSIAVEAQNIYNETRSQLNPKEQELLDMYLDSVPFVEIAEKLMIPIGTVKSRVYHLKQKLRGITLESRTSERPEESDEKLPREEARP